MKRKSILFLFLFLLSIGLAYETQSITAGWMTGSQYGIIGISVLLLLVYAIPAVWALFHFAKKWKLSWIPVLFSLLGGGFIAGWLSSFANTYIHDFLTNLFPDSRFLNALENAIVAPIVEEPLKLLPLAFVLYLIPIKKLKPIFLLGIASGLGFQMIEDISYIRSDLSDGLDYTISRILERITSALASHWTFSGLAILGLYLLYRAYKGQKAVMKSGLIYLGLAFGTHFLFNSPIVELETELPLAFPLVTAITLYSFYQAFQFVEKYKDAMIKEIS